MNPLLELDHVSYTYHSKTGEIRAVSDISFQVRKGEFIAITGPSGCGKSTLLSLISGLLVPDEGKILHPCTGCSDTSIGYMLQKDHLFEWRTVYQNVILGLEIQHKLNEKNIGHVEKMLKEYGLTPFRNARPSELSGGMRQRAALIRTLALDPQLLLLDEPFSALDFQTRLSVCDDVAAILKKEEKTAILVTHDLSEAISMANRILVLSRRPARIRQILDISFEQPGLSPLDKRNAPEFRGYFNLLWKELNAHD